VNTLKNLAALSSPTYNITTVSSIASSTPFQPHVTHPSPAALCQAVVK
jgi:hypothetical protein